MSQLQLFQEASPKQEPQPEPQPQFGWDWTVDSKTHIPVCKRYLLVLLLEVGSPKRATTAIDKWGQPYSEVISAWRRFKNDFWPHLSKVPLGAMGVAA